ncbi:MAG: M48 family metalloprotease [Candidatus Omnitrophica bacterium]|nr:M48 family metalloprotease [Candidatus Omnitrophota bacterium]
MKRGIAITLSVLLLASGCAHHSRSVTDSSRYSTVETELGEAIHRQILQTIPVYEEEKLNHYVQAIGKRLAEVAERKDLAYRFVILQDDRVYATHAPGGYVYLTTGFFKFLKNEIELAGALAEEIGFLQYKDPRLSKMKKAFNTLVQTGSYVGPAFGSIGALSVLGLALVGSLVNHQKSDSARLYEADAHALQSLVQSGYDPQGLINLLHRTADQNSSFRAYLYDYLQAHPVSEERFDRLEKVFGELPLTNRSFDAGRDAYLAATATLRQAAVRK